MEIEKLKNISKLQKDIYKQSLINKLATQNVQTNLLELYKPILSNQKEQIVETKKIVPAIEAQNAIPTIKEQTENIKKFQEYNNLVELAKLIRKYPKLIRTIKTGGEGKEELSVLEKDVLKELDKVDDDRLALLIEMIISAKEPRTEEVIHAIKEQTIIIKGNQYYNNMIELAKLARKYPKLVSLYKGEAEESELSAAELLIYNQLKTIKDKQQKSLINMIISTEEPKLQREESEDTSEEQRKGRKAEDTGGLAEAIGGEPEESNEDRVFREIQEKSRVLNISMERGKEVFDALYAQEKESNADIKKDAVRDIINKEENKIALLDYLRYSLVYEINLRAYPWTTISLVDSELYGNIKRGKADVKKERQALKKGQGLTQFLSSDPIELFKKLNLLVSESLAGNNNVFNEVNAILDELNRLGFLTIKQIKKVLKLVSTNK